MNKNNSYNLLTDLIKYCDKHNGRLVYFSIIKEKLLKIDPNDFSENINYILYILKEKERDIIELRYQNGGKKTQREIAKIIGVSHSRISQIIIKSFNKLLKIDEWKYIYIRNSDKIPEELYNKAQKYEFLKIPNTIIGNTDLDIKNLNLSTISYTALSRALIRTVKDILICGDNILNIRGLGNDSYNEIVTKLKNYGFDISAFVNFK